MAATQPLCDSCWRIHSPGKVPVRLTVPEPEQCCMCGQPTRAGIYVRLDPRVVPFPAS